MSERWHYYLDFKDQTFELSEGEQTVGRSRTCEVALDDPSVSRRHVLVTAGGGRILVKDLGSSNGTFIDGERIEDSGELGDGTTLGLGDADLAVRVVGTSAFETVRMSAHPMEEHGEATLFLQQASEKLAAEAMDHEQEVAADAPSHMAPPPPEPPSHMAPLPLRPAAEAPEPPSHMAPLPLRPAAEAPEPAPSDMAPPPVQPSAAPAAPPPSPPPAAPEPPAADPPPAAAPPPSAAAPPEPAVGAQSVLDPTTGDQAAGDLLPSLDGFDITMGPEMMKAVKPKAEERSTADTAAYNPYSAPVPQGETAAGFGIRLAASLVDGLWIAGLHLAAYVAGSSLGPWLASSAASGLAFLVVLFGWAIWGTTPGKRVFDLYVTSATDGGAGIGFPRALARSVGYVLSAVPLGIGFLMIAFSSSKRGLHDLIAGTQVQRQG